MTGTDIGAPATAGRPHPVPFDPELASVLDALPEQPPLTRDGLPAARAAMAAMMPSTAELIGGRAVEWEERTIPGPDGRPGPAVTVLRPAGHADRLSHGADALALPGILNIHGGGMMVGNRHLDTGRLAALVEELQLVAVNVEYRLAPEHPDPAPVEDCYAALVWLAASTAELGVDPSRLVVMGGSAGGGLSAGVALLARDRRGPALAGQLLLCPMIDDTNTTVSSHQYEGLGTWTREANLLGWRSLLGPSAGDLAAPVSIYAAPSRAADLSNLPPAFIEAGSAELFRDENVDYASRIWAIGGSAELHVWSGGFHGFDVYAPGTELAEAALATRRSWLRRILGL
jgi:acetyl esterase/lipase